VLVRGRSEAEATVGLGYDCDGCGRRIDKRPRGINWVGNRERNELGGSTIQICCVKRGLLCGRREDVLTRLS
jgi:hypothetical protein